MLKWNVRITKKKIHFKTFEKLDILKILRTFKFFGTLRCFHKLMGMLAKCSWNIFLVAAHPFLLFQKCFASSCSSLLPQSPALATVTMTMHFLTACQGNIMLHLGMCLRSTESVRLTLNHHDTREASTLSTAHKTCLCTVSIDSYLPRWRH